MQAIGDRLVALRREMAEAGYDALLVPRADEYLAEYPPRHNERLRWVSGFTGSAGMAVVLADRAALFVDGRYTVQVREQAPAALFEYHHLIEEPPLAWLVEVLAAGATVACDARTHSFEWYRRAERVLDEAGISLAATPDNLVDRCWTDRPAPLVEAAILLEEAYAGESSLARRQRIAEGIAAQGADAALVYAPESLSWLLNIRGSDVPNMPVVQGMGMLESNGDVTLMVHPERVPEGLAAHVGAGLTVVAEERAAAVLADYKGRTVLADPATANAWSQLQLLAAGATLLAGDDPVALPRACKNPAEQAGARRAQLRDAVAVCAFLAWLDAEIEAGQPHDEASLADELYRLRKRDPLFRGSSFDTISAAGPNAALCHYNYLDGSPAKLVMDSVYLVDSGAQYPDGTTDITRTVAIGDPGDEVRRLYTLVLKGHIALALCRFPPGTSGSQLDAIARQYLWREGFDYDHGTGHGVGAYLSVHEGPQRISRVQNSVALRPGMIVSNEPGYYREGAFGMRCENLVLVGPCEREGAERPMLEFETLTLVPFDRRLLDPSLLDPEQRGWLDRYHDRVWRQVGPLLGDSERAWLRRATRPLD